MESDGTIRKHRVITGEVQRKERIQAFGGSQRKLPISRDMYTECCSKNRNQLRKTNFV